MAKVSFDVSIRKKSEGVTTVPDEIIEQGENAIKNYLYRKGHIDHALSNADRKDKELNISIVK